ncbi:MAG: hypothetical protein SGILL_008867 [Bacillariaceae sp.]
MEQQPANASGKDLDHALPSAPTISSQEDEENAPKLPQAVMADVPAPIRMDHDDGDNNGGNRTDVPPSTSRGINAPSAPPTISSSPRNGQDTHVSDGGADTAAVRQEMQQQFANQIQRLEENHQAEQAARQAEYEQAMANFQQQLQDKEQALERQTHSLNEMMNGSSAETATLQRELHQAKELLADKHQEDRRLQEAHLHQLREMEKEVFKKDDVAKSLKMNIKELEQSLETSKGETSKSQADFATLKERAKTVAVELKERRIECRTLSSELELLKANNTDLQERITHLEAAGMDMNESSQEVQEELSSLKSQLAEKEKEVGKSQTTINDERIKGEEALAAYKKKAQQSLALANSRAASAVQSKEEAEMEARAARSTADSAMQRAMAAESSGKQALAEAKQFVTETETEVAKYNEVKEALEKTKIELEASVAECKKYRESNEKLQCELTSVSGRLEAEHANIEDLKQSLAVSQGRSNELYEEVERLRKENLRHSDEIRRLTEGNKNQSNAEPKVIVRQERNPEAEATIAMLKQELVDANQAIKDLKETLKATVEEQEAAQPQSNGGGGMNGHSDGGMPLFYAMEKQAELTQARDEIARLANLLGDAESSKQEALEAMQEMKTMMEDAQSKLQRQEHFKNSPGEEKVNLEYLKNIVLSYLNASTPEEKKTLLPVIGTVLCLTPEEQRKAMQAVDKGNASVIDNVATSVLNLKWR